MQQKKNFRRVARTAVLALFTLCVGLASVQPSLAGCEARCKAAKAAGMCNRALDAKGLKGPERKAEWDKCKADPFSYK